MAPGDPLVEDAARRLERIDFHHPYTPYNVQEEFMRAVYDVLDAGNGQVGILESPTGTGKSLSLICASLTWLRAYKSQRYENALEEIADANKDEPSWMVDQLLRRKREELTRAWEDREERLERLRAQERDVEQRLSKRRRVAAPASSSQSRIDEEEAEWLLEETAATDQTPQDSLSGLSQESREVLRKIGLGNPAKKDDDESILEEEIKIFYTSRTHSQLSQFITEVRRPKFPTSLPTSLASEDAKAAHETVKLLPLSSRQKLCINPEVSRLKSVQAINDRCAELQQPKSSKKCPFVPKEELLSQTHELRDRALATVPDIEDLHRAGKELAVCPYYASRTALPAAEIVTLPYPLLLQKSAREALGIKLEGNVVIIDEAHNIMDAVANVHAAELKLSELRRAREMLGVYVKRFGKKLSSANRVNVGRVGRVIAGLTEWMSLTHGFKGDHGVVDSNEMTRHKGMDQINLFELIKYIQDSKLAYKIESYVSHVENDRDGEKAAHRSSTPVLHTLASFLVALTNISSEGRVFYQKMDGAGSDVQLTYLLLSPTHAFSSIVSSARAIILAGGTMSPFRDYKEHLFPSLPDAQVTTLSCGHVIPRENLCVLTMATGHKGSAPFEFSFQRRGDKAMIDQLGLVLVNACAIVPDGVVVFFPSYGYLEEVVQTWEQGQGEGRESIMRRLEKRKAIFKETKGGSSDEVLASYSQAILGGPSQDGAAGKGAVLLSVVGGKMSEGINFSDRLGRCVVVIGLPYPNIASAEWKAKMEYLENVATSTLASQGVAKGEAATRAKQVSRDFYENSCMRAVNQSIGRAIRHRGDYAAILLVDRRYGTERIRGKLPGWIQDGLRADGKVGSEGDGGLPTMMSSLGSFFRGRR